MPAKKTAPARRPKQADKKPDEKQPEVIRGEFVEQKDDKPKTRAIARVEPASPQELAQWRPEFTTQSVDRAIKQVEEKKRFFGQVMKTGAHYAIIPGQRPTPRINQATGEQVVIDGKPMTDPPKPALLKPGAELLNAAMGLHPVLSRDVLEEMRGDEWYIEVSATCRIYVQTGPGENDRMLVAEAGGSCNSWEDKYRYRGQKGRKCPACSMEGTVRKGSKQYAPREHGRTGPVLKGYENGGFYCWKKLDGCGETFPDADIRITGQTTEKEKNENPHDIKNTLEKMADKRALVAATLIATGCSDLFTQDIEEGAPSPDASSSGGTGAPAAAAPGAGGDYDDPGDPTDAAPAASKPATTAPAAPSAPQTAPAAKAADIPDPEGWEHVKVFNRWRTEHTDDAKNKQFLHFMNEHSLDGWAALKRQWDSKCAIATHPDGTIKQELLGLIGNLLVDKPGFDPDSLKSDLNPTPTASA